MKIKSKFVEKMTEAKQNWQTEWDRHTEEGTHNVMIMGWDEHRRGYNIVVSREDLPRAKEVLWAHKRRIVSIRAVGGMPVTPESEWTTII